MNNDALTPQEAATLLLAVDVDTTVAQSIAVVLNRLAELERLVGEPAVTEWAVRWPDAVDEPGGGMEEYGRNEAGARRAFNVCRGDEGIELVSCEVRTVRGPWTQVQS